MSAVMSPPPQPQPPPPVPVVLDNETKATLKEIRAVIQPILALFRLLVALGLASAAALLMTLLVLAVRYLR